MMKKRGICVTPSYRSNQNGREKEADTQLTADAVEDIMLHKPPKDNPNGDTVAIFSGDQDMCPLIKKARKYGWNVEVWSFTDSLAEAIKTEKAQATGLTTVTIMPLEDVFDKFTFYDDKEFPSKIPAERALLVV